MIKKIPSNLEFYHYSKEIIQEVRSKEQFKYTSYGNTDYKPDGFWISIGNTWENFVKTGGPDIACTHTNVNLTYKTRVFLKKNSRILYINEVKKLWKFTNYGNTDGIDWNEVSLAYNGIIIDYYNKEFSPKWHHSWSIPSGCIWNAAAIERIIKVE